MFAWNIAYWYCCINPRERSVLHSTAEALLLTLWVGVPIDTWDAFWLLQADTNDEVKAAFRSIYRLEIVTIGGEETEAVVVRPTDGYLPDWVSWSAFILTPAAACLDGCQQSRVP